MLSTKRRVAAALVASGLIALPAVALADTLTVNDLATGADATKTVDDTGTAKLQLNVDDNATDPLNGCNAGSLSTNKDERVKFTVAASTNRTDGQPVVTLGSNAVWFSDCGTAGAQQVSFTAVRAGTAVISAAYASGGKQDNEGNLRPARYTNSDTMTVTVTGGSTLAAPTVTGALSGGTAGTNGWYRAAPTATWTLGGGAATSWGGHCLDNGAFRASASVGSTDTATGSVTCSATNSAGTGSDTLNYKLDGTAPTVTAGTPQCSQPGSNGWCLTAQSVTFTPFDATSGLVSPGNFTNSTSGDGSNLSVLSGNVFDNAGNSNSASVTGLKVDTVDPSISVTGVLAQTYYVGSSVQPSPGCSTAFDATSGVASSTTTATITNRPATSTLVYGDKTATCSATDHAGRTGSDSVDYSIQYQRDGGIREPINADGSSVFSQKRAVPVKFGLMNDEPTGFDVTGWTLKRETVTCGTESWISEATAETTSSSTGLRYDSTSDQYIANATLSGTSVGSCYRFVVGFNDGTSLASAKFKVGR